MAEQTAIADAPEIEPLEALEILYYSTPEGDRHRLLNHYLGLREVLERKRSADTDNFGPLDEIHDAIPAKDRPALAAEYSEVRALLEHLESEANNA